MGGPFEICFLSRHHSEIEILTYAGTDSIIEIHRERKLPILHCSMHINIISRARLCQIGYCQITIGQVGKMSFHRKIALCRQRQAEAQAIKQKQYFIHDTIKYLFKSQNKQKVFISYY